MAKTRTYARSFGGGEVTPEFFGRIDDAKYGAGLALCRNFVVLPHGPAANRSGFAFVREVKDSTKRTRIIPFSFSSTQTMIVELGAGYFRFHTAGATLLHGEATAWDSGTAYTVGQMASRLGVTYYAIAASTNQQPPNAGYWYAMSSEAYEIPSDYAEADLFDIHYVQSADVLTLVHPNYPPRELRRLGATQWVLADITFGATLAAPGSPAAVAHLSDEPSLAISYAYKITAVGADGLEESVASAAATCNNNLIDPQPCYNDVSWSAVSGALRYNVYRQDNGLYGYIGQTDALTFRDDNFTPNIGKTPPIGATPFVGAGNYPGAVSYHEQRRAFAGTINQPQNFWATRTGTESNFDYSIPSRDDDAIYFRIAAREANTIRHIVPLGDLILLTSSGEWLVKPASGEALTPAVAVKPQSYVGASNAQPLIVNSNLIYGAARGGHVRELGYNWQAGGYITGDLSLRAPHLFDGRTIVDMAYSKSPHPIVWGVSSSGQLLGMTYVPEEKVGAWHRHDTVNGLFESVAVVAEGDEDVLYTVVQRTIDGGQVRYVERLAPRSIGALSGPATVEGTSVPADPTAFFVDSGLTYDGVASDTISGLDHLEGETVAILADGAVHPARTVESGSVTLETEAEVVHIGLPITADIFTLPAAFDVPGAGQGRPKNINQVWIRVYRSTGLFAGPDADTLSEAKMRTTEPYGSPPMLRTGEIDILLDASWGEAGQVFIRHSDPTPMTIVSITTELEVTG